MSGATWGTVIGGAIGFVVSGFNPMGAQIGAMAGGMIGSTFDTVHHQGPRLGEMPVQTSEEGIMRPIPYGTPPPFSGNIIQAGPKIVTPVEIDHGGGKGGPKQVEHTERVTQTYAVRICEGPATVLKIWRDGKLVADFTGQGVIDPDTYAWLSKTILYTGDETQMPNASLEALPAANGGGIGNVPAYRGTCYMVVDNDDLTDTGGRIPQYQFLVSSNATVETNCVEEGLIAWWPLDDASPNGVAREVVQGLDGVYSHIAGTCQVESRAPLNATGTAATYFALGDMMRASNTEALSVNDLEGWTTTVWYSIDDSHAARIKPLGVGYTDQLSGRHGWGNFLNNHTGSGDFLTPAGGYDNGTEFSAASLGDIAPGNTIFQATVFDGTSIRLYVNGSQVATLAASATGPTVSLVQIGGEAGANGLAGVVQDLKLYNFAMTAEQVRAQYVSADQYFEMPDAPGTYVRYDGTTATSCTPVATIGEVTLAYVLTDIADRCGISAEQMDVADAEDVIVDGYLIGHQMPGQSAQAPPCMAYYGDLPEYDLQIHWIPRGAAPVVAITEDDMLDDDQVRELALRQKIELPRRVRVRYCDAAANHAFLIATAERESINVSSTGDGPIEFPFVFERDVVHQKADIFLKVMTEESTGSIKFRLPFYRYAQLVPSDRFEYDNKEWRIVRLEVADGVMSVEAVRDRRSNYASTVVGNEVLDPTAPVSSAKGPSIMQALNLPRLRTEDNQPGMYILVTGVLPAWPGADIYMSTDGGVNEVLKTTITRRAVLGVLTADITSTTEPIELTVYDNRTLATITDEQIAARQNGIAITSASTSEVAQFQTAAEVDDSLWEITDVSRGLLETTATSHSAGDQFALLDTALYFLPIDISHAGKTLIFRAVTRGTPRENNNTISVVFDPQFTGPEDIEYLLDETGAQLLDEEGSVLLEDN